MTPEVKPLVAGNWKMNGIGEDLGIIQAIASGYSGALQSKCDLLLCVPATLLSRASIAMSDVSLSIGAQDCHPDNAGAHTGDISTSMILDAGGNSVIVGHSERRTNHHETDALVLAKASAGLEAGLLTIICIGETAEERQSGSTLFILERQLAHSVPKEWRNGELVIAYEPVWAIGTGLTPTVQDIADAHHFMREQLTKRFGKMGNKIRILYGGSVKPTNAEELMSIPNVDGALVGGASLKSEDFLAIAKAYEKL